MASTDEKSRFERGMETLSQIHGTVGENAVAPLGDLGRYIVEFAYGEIYQRNGLGLRERAIATVAMLASRPGLEPELRYHLRAALRVGLTATELEEIIIHTVAYAGFPTAMNAMKLLRELLAETAG